MQIEELRVQLRRCEHHRQSLIYQKRYLLLLLAGYQDGEIQTLTAIASLGAHPSSSRVAGQRKRSAVLRFRVAARVITALYRYIYAIS